MGKTNYLFNNYDDAAQKLFDVLPIKQMQQEKWLLLGLSLDSVVILEYLAKKAGLNYDFLFTESICAPNNPDCIIATVSETEEIVIQEDLVDSFGINLDYIYGEAHRKYEENILKRSYKYRKGTEACSYEQENILLVDSGCETGLRVLAALKTVINNSAKSVSFATPAVAQDTANLLDMVIDEIFTVNKIAHFIDTSFYYENVQILGPEVIIAILESSKNYLPFLKSKGED